MRYKDLAIRYKLYLLVGLITFFIAIGMTVAFWSTKVLQKNYVAMITESDYFEITLANISDQLNRANRDELGYIYTQNQNYLDARKEVANQLDLYMAEIEGIPQEFIKADDIQTFKSNILKNRDYFQQQVVLVKELGTNTEGLHGELERSSGELDTLMSRLTGGEGDKLQHQLHMASKTQAQYLMHQDVKYGEESLAAYQTAVTYIEKSFSFGGKAKAEMTNMIKTHMTTLGKSIDLTKKLNGLRTEQQANQEKIRTMMDEFISLVREHNEKEIKDLENLATRSFWTFGLVAALVILVSLGSVFEFRHISDSLVALSTRIRTSADGTKHTSDSLHLASEKVSAATTEQASAIQETVATLNEITAMVNKSVDNATSSAEKATISYQIASEGKDAVNQMRIAMQDIQSNIKDMTNQVDSSNKRIESIVQIINEIASKTQIINDIVFQTKLLSFNASVEAARAGEHGKGFAVVAEEVGNLAQMSGQAAKEIAELLTKSRFDVEQIVKDSKSQMEILVKRSGQKVGNGVQIANRCEEILQEVVDNVNGVKKLMEEISTAAKEEAEGVSNITSAMNEIDASTHANSDMAHETMNFSETLAKQAEQLEAVTTELDRLVSGANHTRPAATPPEVSTYQEPERFPSPAPATTEEASNVVKLSDVARKATGTQRMAAGMEGESRTQGRPDPNDPGFKDS